MSIASIRKPSTSSRELLDRRGRFRCATTPPRRDRVTRRNVDPYRLWYSVGALYLIGYCHVRKDVRLFAVERIRSLNISNRPCQMPLGFDLEAYVRDALGAMRGPLIEIELLFNAATAAWVKDQTWHSSQKLTSLKDGRLKMVLEVSDTPELVGWILHFGAGVQVIRPESVREKVRDKRRKHSFESVTRDVTSVCEAFECGGIRVLSKVLKVILLRRSPC